MTKRIMPAVPASKEVEMIPVEKITDAIIEQAKQGSCKTCKWCVRLDPPTEIEARFTFDGEAVTLTHTCEIQGNMNAIEFSQKMLDSMPYPGKCDEGAWEDDNEDSISQCLAYVPGYDGVACDDPTRKPEANRHAAFMRGLSRAMAIHTAIKYNTLAKLTAKLNEAKESIPAVLANWEEEVYQKMAEQEQIEGEPERRARLAELEKQGILP